MPAPAQALARLLRATSRGLGRSGGTTAPGRMLLRMDPGAIRTMGRRLDDGSVLVSATNGKTTTAAMIAAILDRAGQPAGAQPGGIEHGVGRRHGAARRRPPAGADRPVRGRRGVAPQRRPPPSSRGSCCSPTSSATSSTATASSSSLADRWAELASPPGRSAPLVLNADDPLVADLGRGRDRVVYFGVEDDSQALPELQHAADSKHCRNCGAAYHYEAVYLGHMGRYRCPNCGRERPAPQVAATRVRLDGMAGSDVEIRTPRGSWRFASPSPASTTSTTPWPPRPPLSSSVWLPATWRRRWRASAAPSGGWRRSPWPGTSCRSCW